MDILAKSEYPSCKEEGCPYSLDCKEEGCPYSLDWTNALYYWTDN